MTRQTAAPRGNWVSQSHGSSIGEAHAFTAEGVHWLVREYLEVEPPALDRPSLIFESDAAMRRVRVFPADWRDLSPKELIALSWTT